MNTNETTQHTEQPTIPFLQTEPKTSSDDLTALRAENEKLKESLRLRDAHDTLKQKLKKAGARTPKLLLKAAKHALKFTAEGLLENAHEVVDDLMDRFPEQFEHNTSRQPHISIDAVKSREAQTVGIKVNDMYFSCVI